MFFQLSVVRWGRLVDRDKILDEGCWAGDSGGNTLPRRGVVLTLNRKS